MNFHKYDNAPIAGWFGYFTLAAGTLFVAEDGSTYLHRS